VMAATVAALSVVTTALSLPARAQSLAIATSFLHSMLDSNPSACLPPSSQPPMMAPLRALPQKVVNAARERVSPQSLTHMRMVV